MWVRLKDENGIVSLVNLSQAKYIQPAVNSNNEQAIRLIWQHDTFTDHGEMDLPDESCIYSEQIFTGLSVHQIELLLAKIGLSYPPTENGSEVVAKEDMPESETPTAPEPTDIDTPVEEKPTTGKKRSPRS